jgi:hypothetical protein
MPYIFFTGDYAELSVMKDDRMIEEFRGRISGHDFMSKTGQALPLGRPRSSGARMSPGEHAEFPRERPNLRPQRESSSGPGTAREKMRARIIHFRAKSAVLPRSKSRLSRECPRMRLDIAPWVILRFPVHIQINPAYVLI